jgi:hypothetical protein
LPDTLLFGKDDHCDRDLYGAAVVLLSPCGEIWVFERHHSSRSEDSATRVGKVESEEWLEALELDRGLAGRSLVHHIIVMAYHPPPSLLYFVVEKFSI